MRGAKKRIKILASEIQNLTNLNLPHAWDTRNKRFERKKMVHPNDSEAKKKPSTGTKNARARGHGQTRSKGKLTNQRKRDPVRKTGRSMRGSKGPQDLKKGSREHTWGRTLNLGGWFFSGDGKMEWLNSWV